MRYLIVSDIHGNYPAIMAVLHHAQPYDVIWCLGDLVGYGPNPNECVDAIRSRDHLCVAGNHDWGALGRADIFTFNHDARVALLWTQDELGESERSYLAELPTRLQIGGYLLVHASPRQPLWEYMLDVESAAEAFLHHDFRLALVGHTHIPLLFEWREALGEAVMLMPDYRNPIYLGERRLIVNPGSVGQPRDGDPRAAYAILDTEEETIEFHRVSYPVEITQERMRARGLPERLIERLEMGR